MSSAESFMYFNHLTFITSLMVGTGIISILKYKEIGTNKWLDQG